MDYNKQDPRIKFIRLQENRGQQNAVYCGLVNANGSLIITMDDDLQHPPHMIPALIKTIKQGYDIVYAVNRSSTRSSILRTGTWLNGLFFTIFLKKPKNIEIGSYRIISKKLIDRIRNINTSFVYVSALIFSSNPKPKAFSLEYKPEKNLSINKTRINIKSRFKLFFKLFNNYGPLSFLTKAKGIPFNIEDKI